MTSSIPRTLCLATDDAAYEDGAGDPAGGAVAPEATDLVVRQLVMTGLPTAADLRIEDTN